MIAGLAFLNSDLTTGNMFRDDVDSVQGQELLEAGFPAGSNAPTNVVVTDEAKLDAVRTAVAEAPGRRRGLAPGGAGPGRGQARGHPRRGSLQHRRDST